MYNILFCLLYLSLLAGATWCFSRWGRIKQLTAIKGLDTLALVAALPLLFTGCVTGPTATQSAGIQAAVDIATGLAIQQKDSDPAVWVARAQTYKAVAVRLQELNSTGTATLATLAADLQPLISTLPPADQLAARTVVAALTPYLNAQLRDNPTLAATQSAVGTILAEFISACDVYIPR